MKHYVVTERPLDLPAGAVVELTPEQYACRRHAVEPVEALPEAWETAAFRAKQPIQFKAGERIGTDHEMPKIYRENVIPVTVGGIPEEPAVVKPDSAKKGKR